MSDFDPYHKWLGIPPEEQPAHHYRLLGITDFEVDRDVISAAAERQTVYLRMLQAGEHAVLVAQLLNEISQARVTLLNADQKAEYDEELRKQQTPEPEAEPAPAPTAVMQTPAPSPTPVVAREPVTQEFPVSVVQPTKKPRRRRQQEIWKRPAIIGVSVVGVIGVFVLVISLMSSGDADPVAINLPPSLQQGLVAYYPFNGNARDESGNGNHGEVHGPTLIRDRHGDLNSAYEFSGKGSILLKTDNNLLDGEDNATLSGWYTWPANSSYGQILFVGDRRALTDPISTSPGDKNNVGNFGFENIMQGKETKKISVDARRFLHANDVWTHFTIVLARHVGYSTLTLHINGKPQTSSRSDSFERISYDQPMSALIGGAVEGNQRWSGSLDDIRIYNRALSEAEVKSLYDFESKPPVPPTAPAIESITNTLGMTLNKIPAGTFTMGSPEGEEGRESNETQHEVTISKAFYMQTTEVTQGQWQAVMGSEPWKGRPNVKEGPDYAATYVSWDDAVAYCKKLSEREAKTYRLPTEAEWEYACRAGTETRWSFGNDEKELGDYAWYVENAHGIGQEYAHEVGLKKPNTFGLYDMHGNLNEWCSDYWDAKDYKESPVADPQGPSRGSFRVLRGGSFLYLTRLIRSAYRNWTNQHRRVNDLGFRLVRELD